MEPRRHLPVLDQENVQRHIRRHHDRGAPTLELHDENGALVMWKRGQQVEFQTTGLPPQNELESAMLVTLPPTAYTAIVAGKGENAAVALVEVDQLLR